MAPLTWLGLVYVSASLPWSASSETRDDRTGIAAFPRTQMLPNIFTTPPLANCQKEKTNFTSIINGNGSVQSYHSTPVLQGQLHAHMHSLLLIRCRGAPSDMK